MANAGGVEEAFEKVWKTMVLDRTMVSGVDGTLAAPVADRPAPSSSIEILEGLPRLVAVEAGAGAGAVDLELGGTLGRGGMGVVRLARQPALGREVAVKSLGDDAPEERHVVALVQEASIAGSLEHPNIVPVHVLGRNDRDQPLLVMKRVQGVGWRDLLRDPSHPAWSRVTGDRLSFHLGVLMQVCNAVHFAHSRGVIHRDIKAENVMIGEFGEVYLLDWGVACRASPPGSPVDPALVGTPACMAPEMVRGGGPHIDARTDVYLLGATLHEVLVGRPRHAQASLYDVLRSAFDSAPFAYDAGVPRELAALCNKATSARPEDRHPSALAVRQAIADFLAHRSSVEIADEAAARLRELEAALVRPSAADDVLTIHKRFAECRFGFQQALRAWPESPDALAGLSAAIEAMIGFELARRDAAAAALLLSELADPPPELALRLAALRREQEDEGRDVERLRAIAHDVDSRVSSRQRAIGALGIGFGFSPTLFAIAWLVDRGTIALTHGAIALTVGAFGLVLASVILLVRRMAFRNRFNRRLMGAFMLAGVTIVAAEGCFALLGAPASAGMTAGFVIMFVTAAQVAATLYRPCAVAAAIFLAGAVLSALYPSLSVVLAGVTLLLSHVAVALFWFRDARDLETSSGRPPPS